MADQLVPTASIGSTDWSGGVAPAGGVHTGTSTITMQDGQAFAVASNRAEVLRKADVHAHAPGIPRWVAFDTPGRANPVVLDATLIAAVI